VAAWGSMLKGLAHEEGARLMRSISHHLDQTSHFVDPIQRIVWLGHHSTQSEEAERVLCNIRSDIRALEQVWMDGTDFFL